MKYENQLMKLSLRLNVVNIGRTWWADEICHFQWSSKSFWSQSRGQSICRYSMPQRVRCSNFKIGMFCPLFSTNICKESQSHSIFVLFCFVFSGNLPTNFTCTPFERNYVLEGVILFYFPFISHSCFCIYGYRCRLRSTQLCNQLVISWDTELAQTYMFFM